MKSLFRLVAGFTVLFFGFMASVQADTKLHDGSMLPDKPSLLYNPYDERPHVGLVAADPSTISAPTGSTLYVITHVDVIPPETFPPCKRQVNKNGPCGIDLTRDLVKASRKHNGNMRYDAFTQSNLANHMTTVEMWASESDQEKHTVTSMVKNFRDALSAITPGSGVSSDPLFVLNPMTGSLYDERFYRSID